MLIRLFLAFAALCLLNPTVWSLVERQMLMYIALAVTMVSMMLLARTYHT